MTVQNQDKRPNRKDFNRLVVLASNGTLVDPKEWQGVVGNAKGRQLRKILKENHWAGTNVFDQEAYDSAVKNFRETSRNRTQESRKTLFQQAFDEAGVDTHPRIESALRTVLPLMDVENNQERVIRALARIVSAVDSVIVEDKRGGNKGRTSSDQDQSEDGRGSGSGGNSKKNANAEITEDGQRVNKDGSIDKRTKPEGGISEATSKSRGEGSESDNDHQSNSGQGHSRGESGEGGRAEDGRAEDGRALRKDGQPDKRTKPEGGISEATAKARDQDQDQTEDRRSKSNSGSDGKRSSEKEDDQGNFVSKSDRVDA